MASETFQAAAQRCVAIVGPGSLQNKLLAKLIAERTGYPCVIRSSDARNGHAGAAGRLALVDAADCDEVLPALLASGFASGVALISADLSTAPERFMSYPGVKGVFYADVSEDQLIKGIQAIFEGEYWFPRKLLCAYLERTRAASSLPAHDAASLLTRKELETLRLLATGDSTQRIASSLKVSPHTVKTHIYNLFRKLQVSNRVQAVHWAARNMVLFDPHGPR